MTRFSLVFEHFELAQRWCQVPSGDIAFSDDAQVLHLYQWLFSAFEMELLQVAFSVLEHHASRNICKNLPFDKGYIQANYTFLIIRAGKRAS